VADPEALRVCLKAGVDESEGEDEEEGEGAEDDDAAVVVVELA
jgi:hypothetical protein